jgi:glycosyltransferase involved in cell wall biosynthesis
MRIAINCRSILLSQRTGIGRYAYHLLDHLGQIDTINQYSLHAPKRLFDFKRGLPDFSRYKNFRKQMDYWKKGSGKSDIYHLPSPDRVPKYEGKLIVTVHDLIHRTYPQSQNPKTIELTEKYMQAIALKADHIICVSESTRQDLKNYFQVPESKSSVVYNGVDHRVFFKLSDQDKRVALEELKNLGSDQPYLLFVGTIEPRKNLKGLMESFAMLKLKKSFDGHLVVAGMKGWMMDDLKEYVDKLGIKENVIFTGFISDDKLRILYNMAEVFVYPSFYEGFGFPIVEAFCCGTAVVTSNNSSCAEIAADAAVLSDPTDPKAIALAIEKVLADKNLQTSIRHAGLKRAQEFSFEATAKKTLNVYEGQL